MSEDTTRNSWALQRRKKGSALIITVLVLTIVSFLAISGLRNSERESTTGARSRAASRSFAAADAGLELALNRLSQSPANLNAFDIDLADGANVQSRTRTDSGPQNLTQLPAGQVARDINMGMASGLGMTVPVAAARIC